MSGSRAVALPPLYPILDVELAQRHGHDLVACARDFAALGIEVQQLRAKRLDSGEFLRLADALRAVTPKLIVNDRADVARLAGAAGVHVGVDDLDPASARAVVGPDAWVGVSTHNLEQLRAFAPFADYLAIGPVHATTSKAHPDPVVGVAGVVEARRLYAGPLVAIGGVTLDNCVPVWAAGATAVAVIAALWSVPRPAAAAEAFLLAFDLAFGRDSCHSPEE